MPLSFPLFKGGCTYFFRYAPRWHWFSPLATAWINSFSGEVTFSHPVTFSALKLHISVSALASWLKPHPASNSHSTQLATAHPDWQKGFSLPEMGAVHAGQEEPVYAWEHSSGPPRANQGISKAQRRPCCLHPSGAPSHLPLSRPFSKEPISKGHCRKWHHKMKFLSRHRSAET